MLSRSPDFHANPKPQWQTYQTLQAAEQSSHHSYYSGQRAPTFCSYFSPSAIEQNKWRIEERIACSTDLQNPENSQLSEIDDFPHGEGEEIRKPSLGEPQSLSRSPLQSSSPSPPFRNRITLWRRRFLSNTWRSRKKEKSTWFSDRLMSSRPSASPVPTACIQTLSTGLFSRSSFRLTARSLRCWQGLSVMRHRERYTHSQSVKLFALTLTLNAQSCKNHVKTSLF